MSNEITIYFNMQRINVMFYIKLNGELLPTPYQYIEDANAAYDELQEKYVACVLEIVMI